MAGFPFGQIWLGIVFICITVFIYNALRERLHPLLAGMLLPALAKAKTKAQGIMCMNNEAQLTKSWVMYSLDFDDYVANNYTIPGTLKNAIDWVSRLKDQPFKEKPVAIQSASQGPLGGTRMQYHMRQMFVFLGAFVFNTPEIFVGTAQSKFNDKGELTDEATKDFLKKQLEAFGKYIERVKA